MVIQERPRKKCMYMGMKLITIKLKTLCYVDTRVGVAGTVMEI